jgi:hypothetical protein
MLTNAAGCVVVPGISLTAGAGVAMLWCYCIHTAAVDSMCCAVARLALAPIRICSSTHSRFKTPAVMPMIQLADVGLHAQVMVADSCLQAC